MIMERRNDEVKAKEEGPQERQSGDEVSEEEVGDLEEREGDHQGEPQELINYLKRERRVEGDI